MRSSVYSARRRSFTLIELLVVAATIAVLTSLLLPALLEARRAANSVSCTSNLRQIGSAFLMYHQDYGDQPVFGTGASPELTYWQCLLAPYLSIPPHLFLVKNIKVERNVIICPDDRIDFSWGAQGSYGVPFGNLFVNYQGYIANLAASTFSVDVAAQAPLVVNFSRIKNSSDLYLVMDSRHGTRGAYNLSAQNVEAPFTRRPGDHKVYPGNNPRGQHNVLKYDLNGNGILETNQGCGAGATIANMGVMTDFAQTQFYNQAEPRHGKKPYLLSHNTAYLDGHAGSMNEIEFASPKGWAADF